MTGTYVYKTSGTCSQFIEITLQDDVVEAVRFVKGCSGNLQGLSRLTTGMKIDDIIGKLDGIRCGRKPTSCPDQYARALKQIKSGELTARGA